MLIKMYRFWSSFVTLLLIFMTNASGECERGWLLKNNKCYYFSNTMKTWTEAISFCRAFKADLAVIETQEENTHISDSLSLLGRTYDRFWIDGTDAPREGVWTWASTGQQIQYTNWAHGEPGHFLFGDEDCLEITLHRTYAEWHDLYCDSHIYFICEMELPAGGQVIGK